MMVLGSMVQPGNDLQARMLLQLNEFVKNPISSVVYCAKENKNLSETSNVDSKESVNNLKEKSGPAANVVQSAMEVSNAKGEQRNDVKGSDFDHVAVPTRSETDDGAVGLNHLAVPTPSEADDGAYPPPHPAQGIAVLGSQSVDSRSPKVMSSGDSVSSDGFTKNQKTLVCGSRDKRGESCNRNSPIMIKPKKFSDDLGATKTNGSTNGGGAGGGVGVGAGSGGGGGVEGDGSASAAPNLQRKQQSSNSSPELRIHTEVSPTVGTTFPAMDIRLRPDFVATSARRKAGGKKVAAPSVPLEFRKRRPVIIDGANVGWHYYGVRQGHIFSFKAWVSAMKFFHEEKGYEISAIKIFCRENIVKSYRYANRPMECEELYEKFERKGLLQLTPHGDRMNFGESKPQYSNYDDLFIIQYAKETGGVIVSNDRFDDVQKRFPEYADVIKSRLDPKGKGGPNLDELLHFARGENAPVPRSKSDAFLEKLDRLPDSESEPPANSRDPNSNSNTARFRNQGQNQNPFDRNRIHSVPNRRHGTGANNPNGQRNFGQGIARSFAQSTGPVITTASLKQALLELFPDDERSVDRVLARDQEETNIEVLAESVIYEIEASKSSEEMSYS